MDFVLPDLELYSHVTLHGRPLADEEFLEFCREHEDLRVESNAAGELELMPGTGPETGARNLNLSMQLGTWMKRDKRGAAFDSSTMFVLPSGARRSPDVSWIARERIAAVPAEQRSKLWHICPEFVIELASSSDRPADLHTRMTEWMRNGAELGWLIDPRDRTVSIYRQGQAAPEVLAGLLVLNGEGPVAGFVLDLAEIWEPAL